MKICNNDNSNELEDQEIDEEFEHIPDRSTFVLTVLIFFFQVIIRKMYLNETNRFSLLLFDSLPMPILLLYVSNFYCINPYLRKYVWKTIFNSSSVQPQNELIEIE